MLPRNKAASDYPNQGKNWTREEKDAITHMLIGINTVTALTPRILHLSEILGRSPFAVILQADKMGYIRTGMVDHLVDETQRYGRVAYKASKPSKLPDQDPQIKGYYVFEPSMGKPSVLHPDSEAAMKEAQRLATKNPGVEFEILAVLAKVRAVKHITMQVN